MQDGRQTLRYYMWTTWLIYKHMCRFLGGLAAWPHQVEGDELVAPVVEVERDALLGGLDALLQHAQTHQHSIDLRSRTAPALRLVYEADACVLRECCADGSLVG